MGKGKTLNKRGKQKMLKFKVDQAAFDSLTDEQKSNYEQVGELFVLQVEGAVDKAKINEFRDNNINLSKQLDQYKGVDMDKINALMEQENKLNDAKFIEAKDFDGLIASKTNAMKSDYEGKLQNLTSQLEELTGTNAQIVSKYEIEGAANSAFSKHKISPDAHSAVMAQIKNKFSVNGGKVVAMDGENIELGADGNLTVDEFVHTMPEIFKIQSNGGNGNGNNSPTPQSQAMTSNQKITSGLNKMLNR